MIINDRIIMSNLPFCDSTDIIHDGVKLSERLELDGYLFIRNLIPRDDIFKVRRTLLNIANEYSWLAPDVPVIEGIVNPSFDTTSLRNTSLSAINRMWCQEDMHRLCHHPHILSLFERIFKEPVLCHPKFMLRHFFPHIPPTASHQDRVHVGGGDFCTMWVSLGDCPVEQGVLAIASNSHKNGVLNTHFAGMGIVEDSPWTWVSGSITAGDVLIFANTTVHKSLPNLSKNLRISFDARYQAVSQPISEVSVIPAADSGCVEWEEVYKDWSSTNGQYSWSQYKLDVVPLDISHYEVDYEVAFNQAKAGDMAMRDMLLRLI